MFESLDVQKHTAGNKRAQCRLKRPRHRSNPKDRLHIKSTRAGAFDHCKRSLQKDLKIEPEGPSRGVAQVHPNHLVEFDTASAGNLPQPGDPGFHFQYPAAVPDLVDCQLVRNWRTGTNQDISPLRTFRNCGSSSKLVLRKNFPTHVILLSAASLYRPPFPFKVWGSALSAMNFVTNSL